MKIYPWTVVVQVAVQSHPSVEGVTAKNKDCQGFSVGNQTPMDFKKPLISDFLLLVA